MPARDIGVDVPAPQQDCQDRQCPFHGALRVRGQLITGKVKTARMQSTVVVQREFFRYLPKFERYEKRSSSFAAHNPPCIAAQQGDEVSIMECRPLSKTKHFVVISAVRGKAQIISEDYTQEPSLALPGRAKPKAKEAEEGEDA